MLRTTHLAKKRWLIPPAVFFVVSVFAYPYVRNALMHFDRDAQQVFDTLPMGIALDDASRRLGSEPIRDAPACCLPQRHNFESEFERAEKSDAVHFYLYRNGINWYDCLGFDADGRLVVTGQGAS